MNCSFCPTHQSDRYRQRYGSEITQEEIDRLLDASYIGGMEMSWAERSVMQAIEFRRLKAKPQSFEPVPHRPVTRSMTRNQ
jgi:hypothetical protein